MNFNDDVWVACIKATTIFDISDFLISLVLPMVTSVAWARGGSLLDPSTVASALRQNTGLPGTCISQGQFDWDMLVCSSFSKLVLYLRRQLLILPTSLGCARRSMSSVAIPNRNWSRCRLCRWRSWRPSAGHLG